MNRTHRWLRTAVLGTTLGLLSGPALGAETLTGGMPGSWLMNYTGARTLGLGGAFVASADDPLGVLWNPAGLQRMNQNQLMFENVRLFDDASINSLSFAIPGSRLPSIGVSVVALGSGEFERTNEMNDNLGTFDVTETAYMATLAKSFSPRFAVGTNFKLVRQEVEDFGSGGFGFDVGGIYQLTSTLRVGASALNLGGPRITLRTTEEDYPTEFRGGFGLDVLGGRGLVTAEFDHAGDAGTRLRGGAEYWFAGMALRAGFDDDQATGGFSYRFAPQYQLDYGVANHALGVTHRFGISYRFGGFFASSKADPDVFSPTGERATTKINLNARAKSSVESWSLELVDKSGQVVRRFSGPGQPPPHVQWDGKDETGLPVADGSYTYRLAVRDHDGRQLSSAVQTVQISTSGPQGQVPVITTGQ